MASTSNELKVKKLSDLRVIIVTPCYHILDGVSFTVRNIREEIIRNGGKVLIGTSEAGKKSLEEMKDDAFLKGDLLFCRSADLPYDPTDSYSICRMLTEETRKKMIEFKPSVFHITSPDLLGFSMCEWTRKKGLPMIATWHSNIPDYMDAVGPLQKAIVKPILTLIFRILYSYPLITYVPQQSLVDRMKSQGYENERNGNKLRVWGRGVDIDLFHPSKKSSDFRKKLGIRDDQVTLLWVSRCTREKRPDVWIYVLKKMLIAYPDKVVGILVGRGEWYAEMAKLPNVIPLGWKNKEELSTIYASSDVLFFPSSVETFGNVTLEAMASGIPVIGDKGCSSHLIDHNVTGLVCSLNTNEENVDSYEQYYQACEYLVTHEEVRKEMGAKARTIAETKWEKHTILKQMLFNYVEAANWKEEDIPPMTYSLIHRVVIAGLEAIDKGGLLFIDFFASLSFYWSYAHWLLILLASLVLAGGIYLLQLFVVL